jgi:hypothetical protein
MLTWGRLLEDRPGETVFPGRDVLSSVVAGASLLEGLQQGIVGKIQSGKHREQPGGLGPSACHCKPQIFPLEQM